MYFDIEKRTYKNKNKFLIFDTQCIMNHERLISILMVIVIEVFLIRF